MTCYAPGPTAVMVPARAGALAEPVQLAEDVEAYIYLPLKDGTTVQSRNRVKLVQGGWYFERDPKK